MSKVIETAQERDDRSDMLNALAGAGNPYVFIVVKPVAPGEYRVALEADGGLEDRSALLSLLDRLNGMLRGQE